MIKVGIRQDFSSPLLDAVFQSCPKYGSSDHDKWWLIESQPVVGELGHPSYPPSHQPIINYTTPTGLSISRMCGGLCYYSVSRNISAEFGCVPLFLYALKWVCMYMYRVCLFACYVGACLRLSICPSLC